jgi:pyridoxal 5'-phosphate synthase pdxS subunit
MSELNGVRLKVGLAEMLNGGVIMDVTDARQAEVAERAGAAAVMALERVPAQIRAEGGLRHYNTDIRISAITTAVRPIIRMVRV